MRRTVRVPATTANLGPGFDSFGCALGLYNTYAFETGTPGLKITGCPEKYQNDRNLTVRAYQAVLDEAKIPFSGLSLHIDAEIPVSRGLGSSAAMIAAGVYAANEAVGRPFDESVLLRIATRIEGHPDNLAPAFFGGLTACMTENGIPYVARYSVAEGLRFVVCIPDFELSTAKARQALPKQISHADGTYNVGHGAVLLKGLETGDPDLIRNALKDRLHQPYRIPLIPGYDTVRAAAAAEGALGFCISGAGPTLLALTDDGDFPERLRRRLDAQRNGGDPRWTVLCPGIDREGVRISENETD